MTNKYLLVLFVLFLSAPSKAITSEAAFDNYNHGIYAQLGFWEGGIALGGDYEYAYDRTFGIGGTARYYSRDNDRSSGRISRFVMGAFIRPHFNKRAWDFYVSPGFNLMFLDGPKDDTTVIGPSISFGLLYQFKNNIAFGVENNQYYCWFNDDYRGALLFDLMAKFRYSY